MLFGYHFLISLIFILKTPDPESQQKSRVFCISTMNRKKRVISVLIEHSVHFVLRHQERFLRVFDALKNFLFIVSIGPNLRTIAGKAGVKIGYLGLTWDVKMGYNQFMLTNMISFILRICLIAVFWFVVWKYIEPRTQRMRIFRAALLVLGLLVILAMVRITAQ